MLNLTKYFNEKSLRVLILDGTVQEFLKKINEYAKNNLTKETTDPVLMGGELLRHLTILDLVTRAYIERRTAQPDYQHNWGKLFGGEKKAFKLSAAAALRKAIWDHDTHFLDKIVCERQRKALTNKGDLKLIYEEFCAKMLHFQKLQQRKEKSKPSNRAT